ncbi:Fpg/Nei family DNA glycosylase [Nakamurella flava]|uniref:Fpg/Nei family DNA glycosylase n=1 Tax=Nakamurella flava TaxID=2576308 RepID=A0A4V6CST2_9ACTN|nr:DNA-formamidopyrimidine glycosylase family protein [Nakamurella flava]TKV56825.1 Fpg/Nei family DNA glycosylase [Nakamurella flava]
MPELPEVTALAAFLVDHAVGRVIEAVTVSSLNVMTTYDPPPSALVGRVVVGAGRHGKFLDVVTAPGVGGPAPASDPSLTDAATGAQDWHLVVHLARAGWLRWSDAISPTPPKMGGPIALRVRLTGGVGFDITEAGTRKSVAAAIVTDPQAVPGIARLGPDALSLDRDGLAAVLAGRSGRIKTVITDQTVLAGVGNAYSDEILHTARLSPFATAASLGDAELDRLFAALQRVLHDAVNRSVGGEAARLKGEKRTGLRVHARTGLPCPVCGDQVAEVSFTDRSFQYCPTCQTQGRRLADRRRSRLDK